MHSFALWLAALGILPTPAVEPPRKPEALARAEAARSQSVLRTARLEISVREPHGDPNQPPTRRFLTWRCAGNAYTVTHQGDQDGEVRPWRGSDGNPVRSPLVYDPWHHLFLDGQVWSNAVSELRAEVRPGQARSSYDLFDWRLLGLNPVSLDRSWDETVEESIERGAPPPEYSVRTEQGLHVVTARALESEVTWWIDPQRDWGVVRTAIAHAGKPISEQRMTLHQFDGHWFPARVEEVSVAAGESEPWRVWEVLYAEFNRPTHPQQLGPADIGVEPGRPVRVFEAQDVPPQRAYWDGSNLVSFEEFARRLKAGERFEAPTMAREGARNAARLERLEQLAERGLIDASKLPPRSPHAWVAGGCARSALSKRPGRSTPASSSAATSSTTIKARRPGASAASARSLLASTFHESEKTSRSLRNAWPTSRPVRRRDRPRTRPKKSWLICSDPSSESLRSGSSPASMPC